jgi:transketolase
VPLNLPNFVRQATNCTDFLRDESYNQGLLVTTAGVSSQTDPKPISGQEMRRVILRQSKRANVGHIGSCLSVVEILAAIYGGVLRAKSSEDPDRDRFVLSKGHAALALYSALAARGWISHADLDSFCGEGSRIAVHPEHTVPGVDFCTGSLGQGITMAAGAALAARLQGSSRRVYCLVSDAECNEGSTWEAVMFAAHHRLAQLRVVIDWNGQQALGLTRDVIDIPNLAARWQAFGWDVEEVDGHSVPALVKALNANDAGLPRVVLARTIFGKGVSYMEQGTPLTQTHLPAQPINWHYLPMSDHEFQIAMRELEAADEKSFH